MIALLVCLMQTADVVAAREFGHDAAVGAVHVDLRVQRVGEEPFGIGNESDAGFVAGGFNAKY